MFRRMGKVLPMRMVPALFIFLQLDAEFLEERPEVDLVFFELDGHLVRGALEVAFEDYFVFDVDYEACCFLRVRTLIVSNARIA